MAAIRQICSYIYGFPTDCKFIFVFSQTVGNCAIHTLSECLTFFLVLHSSALQPSVAYKKKKKMSMAILGGGVSILEGKGVCTGEIEECWGGQSVLERQFVMRGLCWGGVSFY